MMVMPSFIRTSVNEMNAIPNAMKIVEIKFIIAIRIVALFW